MLTEGLIFGCLVWISMIVSWWHLPVWLKRFSVKHFVVTDLITTIMTYVTISSISHSLVAAVACIITGLLMELTMMVLRHGVIKV